MVEITMNGKVCKVPEYVQECTPEQYRRLLLAAIEYHWKAIDVETLQDSVMSALLGVTTIQIYKQSIIDEVMGQLDKIKGILDGDQINFETTRNLLQEFHGWKGPGDMFNELTFGQFLEAYVPFKQAVKEGVKTEEKDRLFEEVARALYKAPSKTADPPVMLVVHCINFFASVWHAINTQPINIAGEDIDFSIIFQSSGGGKAKLDDKTGWIGMAMEVAKDGPFGTLPQVNDTPFWDVMIYIYRCKFEYLHNQTKPK